MKKRQNQVQMPATAGNKWGQKQKTADRLTTKKRLPKQATSPMTRQRNRKTLKIKVKSPQSGQNGGKKTKQPKADR